MLGKAHRHIHYFALLLLAIALPTSKAAVNVCGGVLFFNWLLQWNWKEKWNLLKTNKIVLLFGLFFLFFAYGFVATDDAGISFRAWVSKIPFLLPIVIATTEKPSLERQRFLLFAFACTVFVASILSIVLMQIHGYQDIREGGLFISHIRFSICAVMAVLICSYGVKNNIGTKSARFWSYLVMGAWTIIYLFIIQVFTGIILLLIFAFVTVIFYWQKHYEIPGRRWILAVSCTLIAIIVTAAGGVTYQYFHYDDAIEKSLPATTKQGNAYAHDLNSYIESGHKVGLYVCESELRESWTKSSEVPFDTVAQTLVRYLNSKGLTKDAEGMKNLYSIDIQRIESGMANEAYAERLGLKKMLYPTFFSFMLYQREGIVLNSSFLQRMELWKNSWRAFVKQPWTGYGLGRNKAALNRELDKIQSPLRRDMGCHNQFLSYLLIGGIPLLIVFLILYFAPICFHRSKLTLFYVLFWLAILLSLLAEDTLETGTGLYLFLFFDSLLRFGSSDELI